MLSGLSSVVGASFERLRSYAFNQICCVPIGAADVNNGESAQQLSFKRTASTALLSPAKAPTAVEAGRNMT